MGSVKLIYRTQKQKKKSKEVPLYVRIIQNRIVRFVSLKTSVNPEHWDEEKEKVKKSHKNSVRLNTYIQDKLAEANNYLLSLEMNGERLKTVSFLKKVKEEPKAEPKEIIDFHLYAEQYLNSIEKSSYGTYKRIKTVFAKLKEFHKEKLPFDKITVTFLKKYEEYLRNEMNNSINTITSNMKAIRALLGRAIDEDYMVRDQNPFLKYKLKTESTSKEYLVIEEIEKIERLILPKGSILDHHRNMFLFSCFAAGWKIL